MKGRCETTSNASVAEVCRHCFKERSKGGQARLNPKALAKLEAHLEQRLYGSVKEVVAYVANATA